MAVGLMCYLVSDTAIGLGVRQDAGEGRTKTQQMTAANSVKEVSLIVLGRCRHQEVDHGNYGCLIGFFDTLPSPPFLDTVY